MALGVVGAENRGKRVLYGDFLFFSPLLFLFCPQLCLFSLSDAKRMGVGIGFSMGVPLGEYVYG